MRQFTSTICGAGCSLLLLALPAHALPEFQNAAAQPETPRAHPPVSTADMTLFELIAGGIAEHRKQPEFAFEAFFDAAKKTRSAQVAAMAWRAAIAARNPEGNAQHQEQRIAEIGHEIRVGEQLSEVRESDGTELLILEHVVHFKIPVRERHEKTDGKRNCRKSQKADNIGQQKRDSSGNFANVAACQFQHDYSAPFSIPR